MKTCNVCFEKVQSLIVYKGNLMCIDCLREIQKEEFFKLNEETEELPDEDNI